MGIDPILAAAIGLVLLSAALGVFGSAMSAPSENSHPPPGSLTRSGTHPRIPTVSGPVHLQGFQGAPPPSPLAASGSWSRDVSEPEGAELRGPLGRELARGGFGAPYAGGLYFGAKIGLALLLPALALAAMSRIDLPPVGEQLFALGTAILGFELPTFWLRRRVSARQATIRTTLPDLLDVVNTCLEGGQGLDLSLRLATSELNDHAPDLCMEIERTIRDEVAGTPRPVARARLGDRTGVPELVDLLAATDEAREHGTTISHALRGHADAMRKAELARVATWARRLPVIISVVMAIFVLPTVFLVLLGPSLLGLMRAGWPAL